ncbi:MAG: DUF2635 domain-containing protein [Tagaea sp.]|nr:DUF2635 domain-containing protein [Tagaea sp.]
MNVRVKPAAGRTVFFEDGKRILDAAGETLTDSVHWRRREADGDVTVQPVVEPEPKKKS